MSESSTLLDGEITNYKLKIQELERKETEISTQYEKDKALWDGQLKYEKERNA